MLGYGGNPFARYPTAYFRKAFNVIDPSVITNLEIAARINDGMVVYLNGRELLRQNMLGGAVSHTTLAWLWKPTTTWTTNLANGLLRGSNLLAVEVHQASVNSADLIMDLTLTGLVNTNTRVPVVHGRFTLANEGENVHLFNSALERIHRFPGPGFEIGENKSFGLITNGVTTSMRVYDKPTPGFPNPAAARKAETLTSQKPILSIPPGFYAGSQNVVLSTPAAGYRIYYTLNGTDPAFSTTYVYSGSPVTINAPLPATSGLSWVRTSPPAITNEVANTDWRPPIGSVRKAAVLRAIAVSADNLHCSPETRATYFIGSDFTNRPLPLVSLITDTNNLFGFVSGIYVPGKYYADSTEGYGNNKWGKPHANYHQDGGDQEWERPVNFELFETNQATAAVSQMLGATMHGGGTRALPQKALYLHARLGEYGADRVNYPLLRNETTNFYKRFLLRSSGNDWYGPDYSGVATMMKDAVFHRIVKGLDLSIMAYRPSVAYINGEYWGIHNLRESYDQHYLATRYGLEPDNCDILIHEESGDGVLEIESVSGPTNSVADYQALINWVHTNDLRLATNYAQLQMTRINATRSVATVVTNATGTVTNFTSVVVTNCTGMDVTNYTDYIIAETFFANTDWPINNCDFFRAHTNQVAPMR